jgi:CRP/FNR family transcriptional regulator, dissimilatory nitrate respiration regulator
MGTVSRQSAIAVMRQLPLFSAVAEKDLKGLLAGCRLESAPAGSELLSPADRADRFFLILAGRVKIFQLSAKGDEQILHFYGPGDTFGEAAMWAGGRYPAYAETAADCRLLVIGRDALREAIRANPELAVRMMTGMARKLQEFNQLVERLSLKEVPARLAEVLLQLAAGAGRESFELRQSKRELAAQIGTIAETLSRAFAKLRAAGLIEVDGRRIKILDREGLRELAES